MAYIKFLDPEYRGEKEAQAIHDAAMEEAYGTPDESDRYVSESEYWSATDSDYAELADVIAMEEWEGMGR